MSSAGAPRLVARALAALGIAASACRDPAPAPPPLATSAPLAAAPECEPRTTEKLGVPFAKLCPRDVPELEVDFAPFWISAQPLACSGGAHDAMRCPSVTPLHHPAPGDPRAQPAGPSTLAAVVEAGMAQTWCYMRFAGRLPTRAERVRADLALGLATVTVTHSASDPLHFELQRIAEWVTEEPCESPTLAKCRVGMHPTGERRAIPWDGLLACSAARASADAGLTPLELGETCPAPGFEFGGVERELPCAVRSVAASPAPEPFRLTCRPPAPAPVHPPDEPATTAAVRCVMPATMR